MYFCLSLRNNYHRITLQIPHNFFILTEQWLHRQCNRNPQNHYFNFQFFLHFCDGIKWNVFRSVTVNLYAMLFNKYSLIHSNKTKFNQFMFNFLPTINMIFLNFFFKLHLNKFWIIESNQSPLLYTLHLLRKKHWENVLLLFVYCYFQ